MSTRGVQKTTLTSVYKEQEWSDHVLSEAHLLAFVEQASHMVFK
jgi:hypothetical protein